MKDTAADDTVIDDLQAALDGDTMPKAARDYAEHLINRLSQPVRVSILGKPLTGKSELVNMFLSQRLLTKELRLPTTEFVYGETEAMTVTAVDGSTERHEGIDLSALKGGNAAFLKLELPVHILKRVNFLEVVTNGAREEIESAIDWAVRRTDIALWCSQIFDMEEQRVWARVPDSLKDHAFLVLTKADELSAQKVLSFRVTALESIVAEEFHSLFAVATLQAVHATLDGNVDEAAFHASGGGALTSEILRHAERGRRADFDSAHMFLARYQVKEGADGRPSSRPRSRAPISEPLRTVSRAPSRTPSKPVSKPKSKPAPTPKVAKEPITPVAPTLVVSNAELFADGMKFLKRRGDTLADAASKLSEGGAKPLIEQCVDAVEHLTDLFSQDETGCDAADAFIDELAEASDMMVLMQVEDGDGPAADAVTLLLQLRRDMEMQLAA